MAPPLALLSISGVALTAQSRTSATQVVSAETGAPVTTTAPAPTPSTTMAPIVVTAPPTTVAIAGPRSSVTAAPPVTSPTVAAASPLRALGKAESCGWAWDAQRLDDLSYHGVVISLDVPNRPNSPVTMTAAPHGPATLPAVRVTTTDGNGQASFEVRLTEDKRDWTITVSALFATSRCAPQSFTITY